MKTYLIVKPETIEKMLKAFADVEEYSEFMSGLIGMSDEISFADAYNKRAEDTDINVSINMAKVLLMFTTFCRGNIEVIQELIRNVEFELVQQED